MDILLWLDDVRDPLDNNLLKFSPIWPDAVVWVKNYKQFVDYIADYGLPTAICFDHDLGFTNEYYVENDLESPEPDKTGHDCAKFLVEYCLARKLELPLYNIQSANPVGRDNINGLLKNYIKFYNNYLIDAK